MAGNLPIWSIGSLDSTDGPKGCGHNPADSLPPPPLHGSVTAASFAVTPIHGCSVLHVSVIYKCLRATSFVVVES